METWKEAYKGKIPKDYYAISVANSDENGLIIELDGEKNKVIIYFGFIEAIRMLNEGIVQNDVYSEDEIQKYKKDRFQNIIYEVNDGEFNKTISEMSLGFTDILEVKHYILITENFNIDIITHWEPDLKVYKI